MKNLIRIFFFQTLIDKLFDSLNKRSKSEVVNNYEFIADINYFSPEFKKTKSVLISLTPSAWEIALSQYPNIKYFNNVGLTFELVKAFNENGYCVDIVDLNSKFIPSKKYDIYIGHGGKCRNIIDNLDEDTVILQYVAGEYWKEFNRESEERYNEFIKRKNIKNELTFTRSLDGLTEGEEYLTKKADFLFTLNCPRMINSFGIYAHKFLDSGYVAYVDKTFEGNFQERDFDSGRKNFIYVGGTGGNIQKGMDLLIETFTRCPDLNLYIYCKVENELLKYYKKELNLPNIHYIYHWRFKPFQKKLKNLIKKINFTIHAPINTGIGTAFMGSMGAGFIPVGYVDLVAPKESCVLTDSWDIDSLVECVRKASNKTPDWCKKASELTIKNYNENWTIESFRNKFNDLIKIVEERQEVHEV